MLPAGGQVPPPSTSSASTLQPLRSIEGEVERWVEDRPEGARVSYRVRSPQTLESWELQFATPPTTPLSPGDRLRVSGIEQRDPRRLLVTEYTVIPTARLQRKSTIPTPSGALGALRTAVILVNFLDRNVQPYSPAQIHELVFNPITGVSGFFFKSSYKKMWLEGGPNEPKGTVVGWYTLPFSVGEDCPDDRIVDGALQTARQALNNYRDYTHVVVMSPYMTGCKHAGTGGKGETLSVAWAMLPREENLQTSPSSFEKKRVKGTTIHELGHTLGLDHSNRWVCPVGVVVLTSMLQEGCKEVEYGDFYSPMTNANILDFDPDFNAVQKEYLGWFDPENIVSLEAPGTYTYTITPLETPSRGIQTLRILKERLYTSYDSAPKELWYYLEYRQDPELRKLGWMPDSTLKGALVRVNYSRNSKASGLLDMSPTGYEVEVGVALDVALAVGQTFTDPAGITITPLSATSQGLQVQVTVPRIDALPPYVSLGSDGKWFLNPDDSSQVFSLGGPAADNREVVEATFYHNGRLLGVDTTPPFGWKLTDWRTWVVDRSVHQFEARVRDAAGNEGRAQQTLTLITKTGALIVRVASPAQGAVVSGREVPVVLEATDEDGRTDSVVLLVNGKWFGWLAGHQVPYRLLWDTTKEVDGPATLQAQAWSTTGQTALSEPVQVTVRNRTDTTPPEVSVAFPLAEAKLKGVVTVEVAAADAESGIKQVTISRTPAGGSTQVKSTQSIVLASFTKPPYQFPWDTTHDPDGVYTLTAEAEDVAGNRSKSPPPSRCTWSITPQVSSSSSKAMTWCSPGARAFSKSRRP